MSYHAFSSDTKHNTILDCKLELDTQSFNVRQAVEEAMEYVCDVAGPVLSEGAVLADPARFRQVVLNLLGKKLMRTV